MTAAWRVARWALLALSTLLIFGAALAATVPATVVARAAGLSPEIAVAGDLGQGRATWRALTLEWRADRWGLVLGALPAEILVTGPETRLEATVRLTPFGATLTDLRGRAGPEVLALAGLRCDSRATVDIARLAWGRRAAAAEGRVTLAEGTCARGNTAATLPALTALLTTEGDAARADIAGPGGRLATGRLSPTRLRLRLEPEGAALIPGLPASAPFELDTPL